MKKWILIVLTIILAALTSLFTLLFLSRVGMEYNSEGNFFDEHSSVVYHEQAVGVYRGIAFILLGLTLIIIWKVKAIVFRR